jgi:hypothetical protein
MLTQWRVMVIHARCTMRKSGCLQRRQAVPRRSCAGSVRPIGPGRGRNDLVDDIGIPDTGHGLAAASYRNVHRRTGCAAVRREPSHRVQVSRARRPHVFRNPGVRAAGSRARLRRRPAQVAGGSVGVARLLDSELVLTLVSAELRYEPSGGPTAGHARHNCTSTAARPVRAPAAFRGPSCRCAGCSVASRLSERGGIARRQRR